jgi:hypothetical protein
VLLTRGSVHSDRFRVAGAERTEARFVIIDPIQSYLGSKVNAHWSKETCAAMDELSRLAEERHCRTVLVPHLSKAQTGVRFESHLSRSSATGFLFRRRLLFTGFRELCGFAQFVFATQPGSRAGSSVAEFARNVLRTDDGRRDGQGSQPGCRWLPLASPVFRKCSWQRTPDRGKRAGSLCAEVIAMGPCPERGQSARGVGQSPTAATSGASRAPLACRPLVCPRTAGTGPSSRLRILA